MKQLLSLSILLITLFSSAQDYNKWSVEAGLGATKVRDITPVELFNTSLTGRYMPNTKFGVELEAKYTNIKDFTYQGATLSAVVNVGRVLGFESFTKSYTILGGIGGNYSYSSPNNNTNILHRLSNFHLSAFADNEFRINDKLFLGLGLDVVTGVNNRPFAVTTSTETTTIVNFNTSIRFALGSNKEHADWYLEKQKIDTVVLKPVIQNKVFINNIKRIYNTSNSQTGYVFFKHDSYKIDLDYLDEIERVLDSYSGKDSIILTGYASNTTGQDKYNLNLSKKRAEAVRDRLVLLGVKSESIKIEYRGKDLSRVYDVHDLARKVSIVVIKQ